MSHIIDNRLWLSLQNVSIAIPAGMTSIISMCTMQVGTAPSHMPMNMSTHP